MSAISTLLTRLQNTLSTLRAAIWAIDVRDDIADAIEECGQMVEQCYSDVSNPTLQTEALEAALQNKIDQGEMAALTIGDRTITAVKLANGVIPAADATLTTSGGYADAAETGRQFGLIKADLGNIANLNTSVKTSIVDAINAAQADIDDAKADVVTDDIKAALLTLVSHIALYDDGKGDEYCDALRDALYGIEYPDLRTGEIHYGGYLDANGEVQPLAFAYYNDKYFPIQPDTDYIWIRGFDGSVFKTNDVYKSAFMGYRVCYYNEDKEFISREINPFNDAFGYIEPRYFVLNPPEGAKYFRVSWNGNPVGNIYRSIPYDLYAVSIVLANRDDSTIPYNTTLLNGVTFKREGVGILNDVVYGRNDMQIPLYYGDIPDNNVTNSGVLVSKSQWFRNVFNFIGGGTPEEDQKNPDTATRIQNRYAFLMKKGDVISFSGVKAGVRAERIADGHVQHSTAWITTDTDFVIGGDE